MSVRWVVYPRTFWVHLPKWQPYVFLKNKKRKEREQCLGSHPNNTYHVMSWSPQVDLYSHLVEEQCLGNHPNNTYHVKPIM